MNHFDYFKPRSLAQALELKNKIPGSKFIAGGTDLMVQIKRRKIFPEALISLRSVPGFSSIHVNGGAVIGSLATVTELLQHPVILKHYSIIAEAARHLGSPQIRNVATIGGNLCNCSPSADLALPLLVLEAKVKIRSPDDAQVIPIEDFFKGPGDPRLSQEQVLEKIVLEPPAPQAKTVFMKKGRVKMDLAVASTAVFVEIEGQMCHRARVAAGSAAPVPMRLKKVESLLEGKKISPGLLERAQELAEKSVDPITDVRGTEEYRRRLIGVFIRRSMEHILGWSAL